MNKTQRQFVQTVWDFYAEQGRHNLPWRTQSHLQAYNILVSEVMLQQTQVARVVLKYRAFLRAFPSARALASSPLRDVLLLWQGLGYNRRAKYLHEAAQLVTESYRGRWPRTYEQLRLLPGVGPYTAGAVMNFAYNQPVPIIETNVRTVYLHHFFADDTVVNDKQLRECLIATMDNTNPREWFWALMDYGAHIKHTHGNNITKSKHYKKQPRFAGSDRQIRGAILRYLAVTERAIRTLLLELPFSESRIDEQLTKLEKDGLVCADGTGYTIGSS